VTGDNSGAKAGEKFGIGASGVSHESRRLVVRIKEEGASDLGT
jgi:hypothetical protein